MIQIENIRKAYGDTVVLDGFSCRMSEQGLTALLGPSGCGKTTLLRLLIGLERPDSGQITGLPAPLGMVFQEPRLFGHLTALENVSCVSDRRAAAQILQALHLEGALHKKPAELSGGMQQRVAIARALASGRSFLLFDEPFKGFDENLKAQVIEYIKTHVKGGVIVTHDQREAEALGAEMIHMSAAH